jgi:hypothetical protein
MYVVEVMNIEIIAMDACLLQNILFKMATTSFYLFM